MAKILLVVDEAPLGATIEHNLARAGYEIRTADNTETALTTTARESPDLVVIDLAHPSTDVQDLFHELRRGSSVPIILLTGHDDPAGSAASLADAELVKPFAMRDLLANVQRLLLPQTEPPDAAPPAIVVGDLVIDPATSHARIGENEVALKPRELELLLYLVRHRGSVCRTRDLLEEVWGYDYFGDSRTLAVHIHGLREKLEVGPEGHRLIETVRGVGYRFTG